MSDEERLSEFFEDGGVSDRRSFVRRAAIAAAALVGLSGGALFRPGAAAAYVGCSCLKQEPELGCDDCPACCTEGVKCLIEKIKFKDCHNDMLCGFQTIIVCACCCS